MRHRTVKAGLVLLVACVCLVAASYPEVHGSARAAEHAPAPLIAPVLPLPTGENSAVEGPQPFLTVLCKFADVPDEPEPRAFFERLLGSEYPGLDSYWREVSYGRISLAGSSLAGWVTLPRAKAGYRVAGGGADLQRLAQDCAGLGGIEDQPGRYVGLNLVFNAALDVPRGGRACLDAANSTHCYGVTWLWPYALHNQAAWAHEMGHALGLDHSGTDAGRPYGNVWDAMSDYGVCGYDPEFGSLAQHVIAYDKERLGWIPSSARLVLAAPGKVTLKLASLAKLPATGDSFLLAQVPIGGSDRHFYTLEARTRVGYDRNLPFDAVVVHEADLRAERETAGAAATPVRLRWLGRAGLGSAAAVFHDGPNGIMVAVDRQDEDGFVVTVQIATPGAVADPVPPVPASLAVSVEQARREYDAPDGGNYAVTDADADPATIAVAALAARPDGTLYAAWSQLSQGHWQVRFALRQHNGAEWTSAEMISSNAVQDAMTPAIEVDDRGRAYVLWWSRANCGGTRPLSQVLFRMRTEDGKWLSIDEVDPIPSSASRAGLRLVADAADNLYIEWQELNPEGTETYAAFRPSDGGWSDKWNVARESNIRSTSYGP